MRERGKATGKPASDGGPSALVWLVASISLVLPWIAAALAFAGLVALAASDLVGWVMIGAGLAVFALDIAIDLVWAHPSVMPSDHPDLNRRGHQLVGRMAEVVDPIEGGRGKVRLGDTLWVAEGPDAPTGSTVRIRAAHGTVLEVEPPPGAAQQPSES